MFKTLKKILIASAFLFFVFNVGVNHAFAAFTYKAPFTIDHTKVPNTDQTDFPVLISGTYAGSGGVANLKTVGNSGHVQHSSGYDIYAYSDSGLTTRLPAERVYYNATTGQIELWVKVSSLSHTADTVIYLAYGDSGISTDPNSDATYGKTSTWNSGYQGVWHLPDGTTLSVADSTSNNSSGSNANVTATSGVIDGAGSFNGSSARIDVTPSGGLAFSGSGSITLETWLNTNSLSIAEVPISKMHSTNDQVAYAMYVDTTGVILFQTTTGSASGAQVWSTTSTGLISTSTNYHVVITYTWGTGSSIKCYINGVSYTGSWIFGNGNVTFSDAGLHTFLGRLNHASFPRWFNGTLDEQRISNTARSADWVSTEYNNQSSPSTFYTAGAESAITSSLIKTINNLAIALVKTLNGLANASFKTRNGLSNQ